MPETGTITVPVEVAVTFKMDGEELTVEKAVLSSEARKNLKDSDFIFPETREFPIPDEEHGHKALQLGTHQSPSRYAKIKAAVHAKFPNIKIGKEEEGAVTAESPLWKDDAKQLVYGVALTPGVRDSQGDVVDAETIETAAHKFMTDFRKHDVQHDEVAAGAETVESWIAPADMEVAGQQVLKGSWVLGIHVTDPEVWGRVTKGELTGLSIGGSGVRHPD